MFLLHTLPLLSRLLLSVLPSVLSISPPFFFFFFFSSFFFLLSLSFCLGSRSLPSVFPEPLHIRPASRLELPSERTSVTLPS